MDLFNGNIINITNTGTVITPYVKGQSKKIENDTGIWDNVYYKINPVIGFTIKLNPDEDKTSFVTVKNSEGYLRALFPTYDINYIPRNKTFSLNHEFSLNLDVKPTDLQSNIINDIMKLRHKKEWFVNLQTGYGKTLLSIYLISLFNTKSLIMCYSNEILSQWIKTIKKMTTFDTTRLLKIDSSKLLHKIFDDSFDSTNYDIFMATPKLIVSFCEKYGYNILNDTLNKMGIGLKIFDEAHRNITNMVKINGFSNIEKTLYLSADFTQADQVKETLYYKMMYGVPVFKPSDEVMNSLKYTQSIVIEYDSEPSTSDIMNIYGRYGFSSTNYMRYQFNNGMIYDVLDYTLKNITFTNKENYKTLILVSLIENVDELYDKMKKMYGDAKNIGRFHSKVDSDEKELTKQTADIIISTYQSFGTGLDVEKIKYVISIDQCNKVWDNQAAGRARPLPDGSDAYYIMLVDKGFKYAIKKLKGRLEYLMATKIKKISRIKYYKGQ